MARPKKETRGYDRFLKIRVSAEDQESIKARALQAGCLSVSDYLRRMALYGQITVKESQGEHELARALDRIGVNLNQGIKKLNETGRRSDDLSDSLATLNAFLEKTLPDESRYL
jgi:hypothetical protein